MFAAAPLLACISRAAAAETLAAVLHEGNHQSVVGQVTLDNQTRITVVTAEPHRADWLRRIAREMNATDVMHVDVPPREGAPPLTLASRVIRRGDPEFAPALRNYMRNYYGLELRPG